MDRPTLILLDVNETLSDLAPLAARFEEAGVPGDLASTWFASVLRDGFALTAAGATATFAEIARDLLTGLFDAREVSGGSAAAAVHVLAGFGALGVHPDVGPGLTALAASGIRLATLSNGATAVAEGLLERAGLRDHVERLLSVEDAGAWKPAPLPYRWAADVCGVDPAETMLVAVHPWDTDGAQRAGLRAAWINRSGATFPSYFTPPTLTAPSLTDLAEALV